MYGIWYSEVLLKVFPEKKPTSKNIFWGFYFLVLTNAGFIPTCKLWFHQSIKSLFSVWGLGAYLTTKKLFHEEQTLIKYSKNPEGNIFFNILSINFFSG